MTHYNIFEISRFLDSVRTLLNDSSMNDGWPSNLVYTAGPLSTTPSVHGTEMLPGLVKSIVLAQYEGSVAYEGEVWHSFLIPALQFSRTIYIQQELRGQVVVSVTINYNMPWEKSAYKLLKLPFADTTMAGSITPAPLPFQIQDRRIMYKYDEKQYEILHEPQYVNAELCADAMGTQIVNAINYALACFVVQQYYAYIRAKRIIARRGSFVNHQALQCWARKMPDDGFPTDKFFRWHYWVVQACMWNTDYKFDYVANSAPYAQLRSVYGVSEGAIVPDPAYPSFSILEQQESIYIMLAKYDVSAAIREAVMGVSGLRPAEQRLADQKVFHYREAKVRTLLDVVALDVANGHADKCCTYTHFYNPAEPKSVNDAMSIRLFLLLGGSVTALALLAPENITNGLLRAMILDHIDLSNSINSWSPERAYDVCFVAMHNTLGPTYTEDEMEILYAHPVNSTTWLRLRKHCHTPTELETWLSKLKHRALVPEVVWGV